MLLSSNLCFVCISFVFHWVVRFVVLYRYPTKFITDFETLIGLF